MSRMNVAQVIVDALEQAGVKRCYGVAGDTLNHFTDAIRESDIRWVHVRHEEVGGFAAGAEAMLTGELTACAGSCGPGSLHFINGLFESHRNRAPVVLIASQITRDEQGFDFPQEVDFASVYKSCSVFCDEVRSVGQARRKAVAAAQAAITQRGVAVLIVPVDLSQEIVKNDVPFSVHRSRPVVTPADDELDRIAGILNSGKRIAIYGGSGCEDAHDDVVALAARLQAPMAHTSRAKDFLEHDNPYNVGMTGVFGIESGYYALTRCDTLLLLGCDFAWRQFYPEDARIVQIDIDGTHIGRRHPVEYGAVGSIAPTLKALLPRLHAREESGFLDNCRRRHDRAVDHLDERAQLGRGGAIHPQYLTRLIDHYADDDAIFTADGGSPMVWALRHLSANGKRRSVISLTHGTMANAMPQSLGAKVAYPDRQVISLSGDGGLSMLMGDLLTAIQEDIPIKVVVYNNGTLGFVELEQKVEGLLDAFTGLKNPDFAKVAEAIGFASRRVERSEDLDDAVREMLASDRPFLLDVVVDRMELVMPPKIQASQVFGTALYSAKAMIEGRGGDVVELVRENFVD